MKKGDIVIANGQAIAIYDGAHKRVKAACYVIHVLDGYRVPYYRSDIKPTEVKNEER